MSHAPGTKNKYKNINLQMEQMSSIIQKFSFALMTLDQELRTLKDELKASGVIKADEEVKEATEESGSPESSEDTL